MPKTVDEIMNRELFSLRPTDSAEEALQHILALGITGAPVVDAHGAPIGLASFRDLLAHCGDATASERMSSPVVAVRSGASIEEAARHMAASGHHRIVVIDAAGKAVGMISTLDVIRGLLGLPSSHPDAFPHYDVDTGLTWTDDAVLSKDAAESAPSGPGVFVLIVGGRDVSEIPVWVEQAPDVRARLEQILDTTDVKPAGLARALRADQVRFRAAAASDPAARKWLVEYLRRQTVLGLGPPRLNPSSEPREWR